MMQKQLNQFKQFFRREKTQYFDFLDGIRAIAILWIMYFHVVFFTTEIFETKIEWAIFFSELPFYLNWVKKATYAVDLFFVLSAFLISYFLFSEYKKYQKINLKLFYLKRALRIYPLYFFCLVLVLSNSTESLFSSTLISNLLGYNILIFDRSAEIVIPWSWSLSVELLFYSVVPFIILFLIKTHLIKPLIILSFVISISWVIYFQFLKIDTVDFNIVKLILYDVQSNIFYFVKYLYTSPIIRFPPFAIGILLAWLLYKHQTILQNWVNEHTQLINNLLWVATILLILLVSYNHYTLTPFFKNSLYPFLYIFGRSIFSILVGVIFFCCFFYPKHLIHRFLCAKFFFPIAKLSYSIFFFHPICIFALYEIFYPDGVHSLSVIELTGLYILTLAMSIIIGLFTYYFIESWFISGKVRNAILKFFS